MPPLSMLVSLVGSAAAASGNTQVELVLAIKEGDSVAWAHQYAATTRVTIYNKGQTHGSDSAFTEIGLANVGREAHAYLYHIVHRFDSLADKTVFMPGGLPTAGFQGFAQSGGSLLPGVKLEDYVSADVAELFVPTIALSPDLKQFSVRMSLMDNMTESGLEAGKRFSTCSPQGANGWSPFLPNKFASSVLEPLRNQQHAKWDFGGFWARYLPDTPMPERVMAAHGAVFSVTRESIRSHPKSFYEALLVELEGSKDAYQAFFLEHLWWYIFHHSEAAPCGGDVASPDSRKAASRELEQQKRRLANQITVLQPRAGQHVEFGSSIPIEWTATLTGYYRVELWRFGNFETQMYDGMHQYAGDSMTMTWHVYPGPTSERPDAAAAVAAGNITKTFNALMPNPSSNAKVWFHFFQGLKVGDEYTIRVCRADQGPLETICDNVYGESGEFEIDGVINMLSPVRENVYKPGDFVPITWQSYWMGAHVDLKVYHEGHLVFEDLNTNDDGVYTFYIPPDMRPGAYEILVSEHDHNCDRPSCKTYFTMGAHPYPPPPAPHPPPPPRPPPTTGSDAWEVPIIQAFKGSFGLDEITDGAGADGHGVTATVAGGINCDYVCHVYQTSNGVIGRRSRRLLFGGLQYYDPVDTNVFVGCSEDMKLCGCCASAPLPAAA